MGQMVAMLHPALQTASLHCFLITAPLDRTQSGSVLFPLNPPLAFVSFGSQTLLSQHSRTNHNAILLVHQPAHTRPTDRVLAGDWRQ